MRLLGANSVPEPGEQVPVAVPPDPARVTVQMVVAPELMVTVPVGVPVVGDVTVAVKTWDASDP